MIKTIIFDFDDTLYFGDVWQDLPQFWLSAFETLFKSKEKAQKVFDKYKIDSTVSHAYVVQCLQKEHVSNSKLKKYLGDNIYFHAGGCLKVKTIDNDVLKNLAEKCNLYIVSISSEKYLDYYTRLYRINQKHFKKMCSVDIFARDKTKTPLYKRILKEEKVLPEEVLVIGNNARTDLEPAQKLGMKTFLFERSFEKLYDFLSKQNILENPKVEENEREK